MRSPSGGATYTTIPIAAGDAISRSYENLASALSSLRPLSQFLPFSGFDRPASLPSVKPRLHANLSYFRSNYAILFILCVLFSLLFRSTLALFVVSTVILLWLLLHFFREDPLILWGFQVADCWVLAALAAVSALSIWTLAILWNLVLGAGIGILLTLAHGVFRNADGVFLGEEDAAFKGLIAARPGVISGSARTPVVEN